MIRIAVSLRAYRDIKASLPEGSVVYPPERDGRGRYLLADQGGAEPALGAAGAAGVGERGGHPDGEDGFHNRA